MEETHAGEWLDVPGQEGSRKGVHPAGDIEQLELFLLGNTSCTLASDLSHRKERGLGCYSNFTAGGHSHAYPQTPALTEQPLGFGKSS